MDLQDRTKAALAGRYELEREIGRGGMAVVYLGRDTKHGRRVALKVMRPEFGASLVADRFLREIEIVAQLQHPLIIPLFDSGTADGLLWYVMPYVEGETLRHRLDREKQLSLSDALGIAGEIAEALGYAHERGVIHRDIKPENILLSGGHGLVADFGIARAVREAGGWRTSSGVAIGTAAYMSPEQAAGDTDIDHRSDIYSLACVLYEMLAGEPPFTGPTIRAVIARQLSEPPPSLRVVRPALPGPVQRVVERALAKNAVDRFRSAAAFGAALRRARNGWRAGPGRLAMLMTAGAGIAVVATGLLRGQFRWGSPPDSPDVNRIAVLYFSDGSRDGTLEHVARGLTEELIDQLSGVAALSVIPATGVRAYRGRDVPLDSIVRTFNAGTVVTGKVDSTGGQLHVTVQFIDGAGGAQRDSEVFAQAWAELPVLGRAIATEVSRFLRRRLGEEIRFSRRREEARSVDAWDLMRRAEVWREDAIALSRGGNAQGAFRTLLAADSLLGEAEKRDPRWVEPKVARGWLMFDLAANAEMLQVIRRESSLGKGIVDSVRSFSDWLSAGISHAERALSVSRAYPKALELRGALQSMLAWQPGQDPTGEQLRAAEADLRAAVTADMGLARAWRYLAVLLRTRGEFAEAALAAGKALAADAYLSEAPAIHQLLLFAQLEAGQFDSAAHRCSEGRRQFPQHRAFVECELTVLGWSGRGAADAAAAWMMLATIERADSLGLLRETAVFRRTMVAAVLARSGLRDSALRVIEGTRAAASHPTEQMTMDHNEAYVRLLLGEHDASLKLLRSYLARNPQAKLDVARSAWFRSLRGHPEFDALVATAPR